MSKKLSVLNFLSVILVIAVNYLAQTGQFSNNTMASLSREYDNLFTPAGYAFSIWGIIFISLLFYAQKLVLEPVFKYNLPGIIPEGKTARFVVVLPKFSIAGDKVVVIDLKELNGERDLKLRIRKRVVNNPE
jgi:hypothetical protein